MTIVFLQMISSLVHDALSAMGWFIFPVPGIFRPARSVEGNAGSMSMHRLVRVQDGEDTAGGLILPEYLTEIAAMTHMGIYMYEKGAGE